MKVVIVVCYYPHHVDKILYWRLNAFSGFHHLNVTLLVKICEK